MQHQTINNVLEPQRADYIHRFTIPLNTQTDTECYITNYTIMNMDYPQSGVTHHSPKLTDFPVLPDTMIHVHVTGQYIRIINTLPDTLQTLDIQNNMIAKIPDKLPQGLMYLNCSHNFIDKLPDILPATLYEFNCANNQLKQLPDMLAEQSNMYSLYCTSNKIAILPDQLPKYLSILVCSKNQLAALPEKLPAYLSVLWCDHNIIRQLTISLPTLLKSIKCAYNKLTLLPDDLYSLKFCKEFNCSHNKISTLPDLLPPNLITFEAEYNYLYILPDLPESIQVLNLVGNALEYNYPDMYDYCGAKEQILYINQRNRELRQEWLSKVNVRNVFLEMYMRRVMHPKYLADLKINPNLVVDTFIKQYVDGL